MKVGLIARADDRGLGHMTWELHRHLHPDRTLVVREPGAEARGFMPHLERFPGATVVPFDGGQLDEDTVRRWLLGLDVVYSAETFYDWALIEWARDAGVATVLHAMPEFYRPASPATTALWAPTPWRIEHLPNAVVVPVPVAVDRFTGERPEPAGRLRVLHVAGHRAAGDRNGTQQLLRALRLVREPMDVRILTQDQHLPRARTSQGVTVAAETGGRAHYWDLYADADVLVMPRRYGGLCLPVQEAMAAGLAVVMPDVAPNDWWPTLRVHARVAGQLRTPGGEVPMWATNPIELARQLDYLATQPAHLAAMQDRSLEWARAHSWDALAPLYRAELAAVG